MTQIRAFLKKRYGFDTLSILILLIAVVLDLLNLLPVLKDKNVLGILAMIPLAICLFRIFSTDVEARRRENRVLLKCLGASPGKKKEGSNATKSEKKLFKFFQCPKCKQKVRVPRGVGKVEILCPQCSHRFVKKA